MAHANDAEKGNSNSSADLGKWSWQQAATSDEWKADLQPEWLATKPDPAIAGAEPQQEWQHQSLSAGG